MNYGQRFVTLYRRQGSRPSPWKINAKKTKMAVWGGLTNSCEKKRSETERKKGKIYPFECRVHKNSKERSESLPQGSVQRNREKIEWERLEISSRKSDTKGTFLAKMGTIKDRNCMELTEA